jgi:hypothetical protein
VCFPNNRQVERKAGRVPKLAPGAGYSINLEFAIHVTAQEASTVTSRIAAIQGEQKPVVEQKLIDHD